ERSHNHGDRLRTARPAERTPDREGARQEHRVVLLRLDFRLLRSDSLLVSAGTNRPRAAPKRGRFLSGARNLVADDGGGRNNLRTRRRSLWPQADHRRDRRDLWNWYSAVCREPLACGTNRVSIDHRPRNGRWMGTGAEFDRGERSGAVSRALRGICADRSTARNS